MSTTTGSRATSLLLTFGNGDCGRLGHGIVHNSVDIPKQVQSAVIEGVRWAQVACGGAHTLALTEDGQVFSFGLNDRGQLGHSEGEKWCSEPQEVPLPEDVVQIAAGHYHSLAVDSNGMVWSWGCHSAGQLGIGVEADETTTLPRLVKTLSEGIRHVAAGASHSLAVSESGSLYSFGEGTSGRLGHSGTARPEHVPRRVDCFDGIRISKVSAGHMHSGCVDEDGYVYMFGNGRFLQLGTGASEDVYTPTQVRVGSDFVKSISCGGMHTITSGYSGETCVWGAAQNGCLGLGSDSSSQYGVKTPTPIPKFRSSMIAAGWKHTASIDDDGQAWTWGWGGSQGSAMSLEQGGSGGGQLGCGDDCDIWSPRRIYTIDVYNGMEVPQSQSNGHQIWRAVSISCGLNHSAMIAEIGFSSGRREGVERH
jgi:alpha-tubulin suppressor-like RCC1 family protein